MAVNREALIRNLWASPALFITAAFMSFVVVRTHTANRVGWILYFVGWLPPLTALGLCAARKERPDIGGAVALVLLAAFGLVFRLNHA